MKDRKTLIYIIGAGRSGTTLLDIILGNNEDAISLGEINRFYKRKGYPPKRESKSKEFEFWDKIRENLSKKVGGLDFKKLEEESRANEYHSNVLKKILGYDSEMYSHHLRLMYETLHENIEQNLIVESSKYPLRGVNLSRMVPSNLFDIKYVYLKKDPISVVASFQKKNIEQPSKGFISANIYYLLVNLLCKSVVLFLKIRGHMVSTLRYEDLIGKKGESFKKLSADLAIDFKVLQSKLTDNTPLHTGYLFDGNRIRLEESLTLRSSEINVKKNSKYYFTRILNYIVYK
ncbi:sulfotransferase [Mangrovimonas sp. TPBH4]|uniref:sulfotransferase n=1 Tax=Mangrovimonas sp. TPBH4 TaxID=1645914 RepID=UPI0006B68489|nr:sulfotransferase [Mangrovimonas sp. TPBH4]